MVISTRLRGPVDLVHIFTIARANLTAELHRPVAGYPPGRRDLGVVAEEVVGRRDRSHRRRDPRRRAVDGARRCEGVRGGRGLVRPEAGDPEIKSQKLTREELFARISQLDNRNENVLAGGVVAITRWSRAELVKQRVAQ